MNLRENKRLLILVVIFCGVCVTAQKRKPVAVEKQTSDVNYSSTIEVDENSRTKIIIESDSTDLPASVFSALNQKTSSQRLKSNLITIKPNPGLKYEKVVNVIEKIRKSAVQNIKVELSNDFLAVVSKPLEENFKPNPLFLVVGLDEAGKVSLNNEVQGTINDLTRLKNFLRQIFKERTDNGVFREGTNEVETTVFIKAPLSADFSEVIKIAEALRESGVSLVGLQTDEFVRTVSVEKIDR